METGLELKDELKKKRDDMTLALKSQRPYGKAWALAEKNYRIALKKKMLIERDKGTPVTILSDVCRGDEEVAELKFKRDVAWVDYQTSIEAVNVIKIEARQIESEIEREWKG